MLEYNFRMKMEELYLEEKRLQEEARKTIYQKLRDILNEFFQKTIKELGRNSFIKKCEKISVCKEVSGEEFVNIAYNKAKKEMTESEKFTVEQLHTLEGINELNEYLRKEYAGSVSCKMNPEKEDVLIFELELNINP